MIASAVAIHGGSPVGVESALASQATTCNALFRRLTELACGKPRSAEEFAVYFKLVHRAQSQSAKALEILANLKQNPRVVFAGQVYAAHQQIVHNSGDSNF